MDLGPSELIIILVIVLLLFGGRKLPELARSLGHAKKEFENATDKAPAEPPKPSDPVVPAVEDEARTDDKS